MECSGASWMAEGTWKGRTGSLAYMLGDCGTWKDCVVFISLHITSWKLGERAFLGKKKTEKQQNSTPSVVGPVPLTTTF